MLKTLAAADGATTVTMPPTTTTEMPTTTAAMAATILYDMSHVSKFVADFEVAGLDPPDVRSTCSLHNRVSYSIAGSLYHGQWMNIVE